MEHSTHTEAAQHTPGIWRMGSREETDRGAMWAINGWQGSDAPLRGDVRLAEVFSIEANARLIAAAPDLLAALEQLLDCPAFNYGAEPHAVLLEAARGAIAKARA